jgi:hypothetical protein
MNTVNAQAVVHNAAIYAQVPRSTTDMIYFLFELLILMFVGVSFGPHNV